MKMMNSISRRWSNLSSRWSSLSRPTEQTDSTNALGRSRQARPPVARPPAIFAALILTALLLSCNQDETAFGPQDLKAFESSVSGRVTDRQGRALSGALVTVLPSGTTTVTGRDGAFTVSGLATGSYRISVVKDDYRDTMWLDSARLGLSVVRELGSIGMRSRYATITGIVEDSAGAVQPSAGVVVEDQSSSAMAASRGNFVLGRVVPGRVRLFSAIKGTGYGVLDTTLESDDTLKGVKIRINRRGGTVTGQIVDESDNALTGASVSAVGGALQASSGSDGAFRIGEIPSEGNVVFVVSKGDRSAVVSGIRVREGGSTDLLKIVIPALGSTGDARVLPGIAIAYTTDRTMNLVASSEVKDTTFKVLRHLWSIKEGGSWDTTSTNTWGLDIEKSGWKEGLHQVRVKLLAVDGRTSDEAIIRVRLVPPPDWTKPTIVKVTKNSTFAADVESTTVKWIVTDDIELSKDSVKIQGQPVTWSGDTAWQRIPLKTEADTIRIRARDRAGNVATDFVVLTRSAGGDDTRPKIDRVKPVDDTLELAWPESTAIVVWTVKDGNLREVKVDASPVELQGDTVSVSRTVQDGATIRVVIHALDSVGNEASDTVYVARASAPAANLKLKSLVLLDESLSPSFDPDSFKYSASVDGNLPDVIVEAAVEDSTQALVRVNGKEDWSPIRLDTANEITPIRVTVLAKDGMDSLFYTIDVRRRALDETILDVTWTRNGADTLWPLDTINASLKDSDGTIQYSIDDGILQDYPENGIVLTKACSVTVVGTGTGKKAATWGKRFGFTTWNPAITYGTVPHDGQTYRTVKIGDQTWMAENLNVDVDNSWWYDNSADSGAKYGRLYTWAALMALPDSCNRVSCSTMVKPVHQGICPSGWHVPSGAEWSTLTTQVGDEASAGNTLKSTAGWDESGNGTDGRGFRILPGGFRYIEGQYGYSGSYANIWSATEATMTDVLYRYVYGDTARIFANTYTKAHAFSARCVEGADTSNTSTRLKSLKVDSGKLSPFDSSAFVLVDTVTTSVNKITLTAETVSSTAKITYNESASSTVDITSLDSVVVKVTNFGKSSLYVIRLYRVPNPVADPSYGIPFAPGVSFDTLTDSRDGQKYRTLEMRDGKIWMAENLNFQADKSWPYERDIDTGAKYGRLYTWASAMGLDDSCNASSCSTQVAATQRGICPTGWHVPTRTEWGTLVDSVGIRDAGSMLKSSGGWDAQGDGVDELGFRILPSGNRSGTGVFAEKGRGTAFWSTAEMDSENAYNRAFKFDDPGASDLNAPKASGLSLRCIKN